MNYKEAIDIAEEAMDKDLPSSIKRRLDLHLSRCESCRRLFEAERAEHARWFRIFNDPATRRSLPPDFADRLAVAARLPRPSFWSRIPRWMKIAACLALFLSGAAFAATVVVDAVTAKESKATEWTDGTQTTEGTEGGDAHAAFAEVASVIEAAYVPDIVSVPSAETPPSTNNQLESKEGKNKMNIKQKAVAVLAAMALATTPVVGSAANSCIVSGSTERTAVVACTAVTINSELDTRPAPEVRLDELNLRTDEMRGLIISFK